MTQEFVTLPREVVEQAVEALFCMDSEEGSTAYKNELEAIKKLRAALEHQQNHVPDAGNMVPAGWRLVPVEPTEKMVDMGRGLSSFPNGVYRAMLSAAPQPPTVKECLTVEQPQANQPAMTPIAQRKLDSLLTEGYTISGYSVYHEQKHQHGFVTGAGLVGWWKPEGVEYPQPKRPPLTDEQIDAIADAMPGGLEGFMKGWGWRQFARAVLENDHNTK